MGARQVSKERVKGANVVCYLAFNQTMTSDKVLRMMMLFIILYFFRQFFIYLDKNKRQGVKGGNVVCCLAFN